MLRHSPIDQGDDRQGIRHDSREWLHLGMGFFGPVLRGAPFSFETGLIGGSSRALISLASRQKGPRRRHLPGNSRKVNIMSPDQLLYTVPEAAKLLRISPAHAYALVSRGELPSLRLGRRILIPRCALESLIAQSSGVPEAGTAGLEVHGQLASIRSRHRAC